MGVAEKDRGCKGARMNTAVVGAICVCAYAYMRVRAREWRVGRRGGGVGMGEYRERD